MEEIIRRRSIRKYQDRPVEASLLAEILESARLAPSGSNTQPWHFIIIRSPETHRKIVELDHGQSWMLSAPLMIACVADICCRREAIPVWEESPEEEVKQIIRDTAIAVEHMVLTAESLGLGACWTAWFRQKDIRPVLGVPDSKYVCAVLTLGYPAEQPAERPRRSMESMLHYETW